MLTSVDPRDEVAELRAQIAEHQQLIAERDARITDYEQRVATHPAARVDELAPDRWAGLFGPRRAG